MLRIRDDGGVPDQTLINGKAGHFGIKGVRERAYRIGATLTISSSPKSGTTVDLALPGKAIFRIWTALTRRKRTGESILKNHEKADIPGFAKPEPFTFD
jgi:signal transduction histidine kinase